MRENDPIIAAVKAEFPGAVIEKYMFEDGITYVIQRPGAPTVRRTIYWDDDVAEHATFVIARLKETAA